MGNRSSLLGSSLLVVMAASVAAAAWLNRPDGDGLSWGKAPPAVQAVLWPEPRPLTGFALETQHGEPFDAASLEGRWNFLFFGYLSCPDVCPISLHAMRAFRQHLTARNPSAGNHRFIFVTVDPEHDRPENIGVYLEQFDPEFIGLHGPMDEIARLAELLAVKHMEFTHESGYRSIDHTSSLMIVDPKGRAVGALPPPLKPERMVEQFEGLHAWLE